MGPKTLATERHVLRRHSWSKVCYFEAIFGAFFVMNSSRAEKMRHRENIGPAEWI